MRLSCLLSYTDHVPLEAINKELSRHESNSQQAIIMELSCEESCCSAGNNQAAEKAGITQHSWQLLAANTRRARRGLDEAARQLAQKLGVDHLEYRSREPAQPDWIHQELYFT